MRRPKDDCIKHRLTDRSQMLVAVKYLLSHGIPEDRIAIELSRIFYVDIDELNLVLDAVHIPVKQPAAGTGWGAVA
ncbi:hypothetical protein L598_002400000640 [Mesorhizobium sp. J18]|uniref:hypothetical protein n=1 Tax=Mesorhizobium sp. J18 TaxID=935263 RepID=UPI00119A03B6|nr:hypothetical protein [Mesorhizobium sp. J18]TWG96893.1 hypothetical protein L598_002400000640 [Mesorhizobium sp. J18]